MSNQLKSLGDCPRCKSLNCLGNSSGRCVILKDNDFTCHGGKCPFFKAANGGVSYANDGYPKENPYPGTCDIASVLAEM